MICAGTCSMCSWSEMCWQPSQPSIYSGHCFSHVFKQSPSIPFFNSVWRSPPLRGGPRFSFQDFILELAANSGSSWMSQAPNLHFAMQLLIMWSCIVLNWIKGLSTCVLKASGGVSNLILSIDTRSWHPDPYSVQTLSRLDQQLVDSQSSVDDSWINQNLVDSRLTVDQVVNGVLIVSIKSIGQVSIESTCIYQGYRSTLDHECL